MLLIDAYNVIRAQWVLPREMRGMDVRGLLGLVARSRYAKRRVRVVCDGRPGPEWRGAGVLETLSGELWTRVGRAEVVFSGAGREADDVIEEILAGRGGLAVLMVSSDRRLVRAAGRAGADQVGNGTFLNQLAEDARRAEGDAAPAFVSEVPLDAGAVAHWMEEFGLEAPPIRGVESDEPERESEPTNERRATSTPAFGERLVIPESSSTEASRTPEPMKSDALDRGAEAFSEHEPLDPLLAEAFEEWRGRLSADDLDMSRWIRDVEPIRPKRGAPGPRKGGRGRRR